MSAECRPKPRLVEANREPDVVFPVPVGVKNRQVLLRDLEDLPPTISVEEAAELAGVGRAAGYSAVRTDEWPHIRVGRTIRVLTAPFLRLLGVED